MGVRFGKAAKADAAHGKGREEAGRKAVKRFKIPSKRHAVLARRARVRGGMGGLACFIVNVPGVCASGLTWRRKLCCRARAPKPTGLRAVGRRKPAAKR